MPFLHRRQQKAVMAELKKKKKKGDVVYSHVMKAEDISKINDMIRKEIEGATDENKLMTLHKRSQYLVTLSQSPAWRELPDVQKIRSTAMSEFSRTSEAINKRLQQVGSQKMVDTKYGPGGEPKAA